MIDSKLTFKIQEIPDGKSERKVSLFDDDLEFDDLKLKKAVVEIQFEKTTYFINVDFDVKAFLMVTCDRSLEEFEQRIQSSYKVLFKPEIEEVSEGKDSKIKQFNIQDLTLSIHFEVRDTILLELPVKKLHPKFLDEEGNPLEFETRTYGDVSPDDEDLADPRWEALKKLKN